MRVMSTFPDTLYSTITVPVGEPVSGDLGEFPWQWGCAVCYTPGADRVAIVRTGAGL